jgi:hypothetical protein
MNPQYLSGLTPQQRLLQQRAIRKSQKVYEETGRVVDRPKVSSKPTPRSSHAKKFEDTYGFSFSENPRV